MITISLCMIVKNEEKNLRPCVESLSGIYDELIIVDTGSVDRTKEIAKELGAQVFDYEWKCDFADARNFAFSKASCDYIYSADADETIDAENREKLRILKENMDERIDIVQMWYRGQTDFDTVYNFDKELRPKLFKRLRTFVWEGAVHEQVRTEALVFDSDVEIDHHAGKSHAARDLEYFRSMVARGETLSARLHGMYARELCKAGTDEDFALAREYFVQAAEDTERSMDEIKQSFYIVARAARQEGDRRSFMKYALRDVATEATSEMCFELGVFYRNHAEIREAIMWFYNAAYEAAPLMDIHRGGDAALAELSALYRALGEDEEAAAFEEARRAWIDENQTNAAEA